MSSFKDHFSGHAAEYAAHRPVYPPELAQALAALCPARRLAWDVGCGNGQLSRLLADQFERVVATDASAAQIAQAAAHRGVTYLTAPAEHGPLEDASADLIVAAQAAHWFDLPAFWREVNRVASPGAVVALVSYGLFTVSAEADAVVRRLYADLDAYWPPERRLVEDGYASIAFPYAELAKLDVAMTASWTVAHALDYLRTWSAVKAYEKAHGSDPVARIADRLAAAWGSGVRPVRWPLAMRLGRV